MPSTARPGSVAPLRRSWLAVAAASLLALGAPAWSTSSPAAAATPDHTVTWGWPVEGSLGPTPTVLRGFDPPDQPWLPGHRGADLAAEPFSLVRAAGAGVVVFAGPLAGRGVVSVDHPDGLRTTYEPVDATVVAGEPVALGTVLGLVEPLTTHCARACLHWGVRRGDVYLDPLTLVERPPPVLLPYGPPVLRAVPGLSWQWPT